ncbi:MAG: oxidoreductase [Candidatus Roizmanbacteria bacterium]|nr:oxidoreductase [Candidatus Roizmanbacteria bacterium]
MYRLVLYYLIGLVMTAVVLSFLHILSFNPFLLMGSTLFLIAASYVTNTIFSLVFEAPVNVESVYISALILALIVNPASSLQSLWFLFWAATLTMATKYIFALKKKHIFNPVAIALVLTAIGFNGSASWWVGTASLTPFVLIGGMLIVRKIKREDLVITFFTIAFLTIAIFTTIAGGNAVNILFRLILNSSLLFLGFVMLTEPLTTPPTWELQVLYGAIVGFLFAPQIHILGIYSTPELALCVGNIFVYLVSPKYKLFLRLKEKIRYGTDVLDFIFPLEKKLNYIPGQYMEWTLDHHNPDSRGNRRYLTIASSPTEDTLHLGVKFYPNGSSFKKSLATLDVKNPIVGGQLAGDFCLPKNKREKCVFIAGGIGITPFRSMIKYLVDRKEPRDIILFYVNKHADEIAYTDIFEQARAELGIRTVYTLTDQSAIPQGWTGRMGRLSERMIQQEVADYRDRIYYLSGPFGMVTGDKKILREMGVPDSHIKTDYFPGFA